MTEIKYDDLNVVDLVDLGIAMQAIENKLIVKVDQYKSGYECKMCLGTGKVVSIINPDIKRDCDECKGKGQLIVIPDTAKSLPSTGVIMSMGPACTSIRLKKELQEAINTRNNYDPAINESWTFWNEEVKRIEQELKECLLHVGTRIVFGTHTGTKIPLRGEIKLTIMTEKEPLCVLFGTNIEDKAILDYTAENI